MPSMCRKQTCQQSILRPSTALASPVKMFTNIVACAAGPKAKTEPLKKLTDNVFSLDTMDSNSFKKFFQWVSIQVMGGGRTIRVTDSVELPPPPQEVNIVI